MNLNKYNFIYPIILTIASFFLGLFLWDKINLEFSNPLEIVGEYDKYSHNVLNDTFRYLVFVLLPVFTFFLSFLYFKKSTRFFEFKMSLFKLNKTIETPFFSKSKLIILIFFLSLLFLFQDWNEFGFSIFEEGMPLSGSTNFEMGLKPWLDLYLNTGLFHDLLNAKISWTLFDYKTIGSYKFYIKLLDLISHVLVLYFLYKLSCQISSKDIKELFFLLTVFFFFISLNNAILWKDIPVILFLTFILKYLNSEKKNFSIFIISFLSVFTFFWSLDRGFIIFLTFIPFLILVFINNKKDFIKFVLTLSFYIGIFSIILGHEILLSFLIHSSEILTQHEMINGIIHPQPFSDEKNATRATKALLLIIINSIYTILIIFYRHKLFNNNTKFLFIFFQIINFLIYKSALSRSDGGHIQIASYLSILIFLIYTIFFILNYLKENKYFTKFEKKENLIFAVILVLVLNNNLFNYKNIYKFPENINRYISANDNNFLDKEYYNSLKKVNSYFSDKECLFSFSYDLAIFYLINKKSCSKFSNVWVIGSKKNQKEYVDQLNKKKPLHILQGGVVQFQSLSKRYPYIENYINNNYMILEEFNGWKIYKRIN